MKNTWGKVRWRLGPLPIVPIVATLVFVTTFLPWSGSKTASLAAGPAPCRGGTLRVTYRDDFSRFDPGLTTLTVVRMMSTLLFDTLFEYKEPELTLVPRLAESWEQRNATTLTIRLRRGVRFHNGLGMRAEDVKFTLDRIRDPKGGSPWAGQFADIDRVEIVDPWTVRLILKQPSAPLLGYLAHFGTSIVPKAYVESGGDLQTQPIGTGPYQYVRRVGSNVFLTRNKNYWRQGLPYPNEVVWSVIPDINATAAAIRSGAADVALKIGPEIVPLFQRTSDFQLVGGPTGSFVALWFNVREKPLDDWRVRQAIAWAVDRDQVLKAARGDLGEVLPAGPIPRSHWAAIKQPIFKQDYEKARALLREAGLDQGFKWTLTIASVTTMHIRAAEVIKEQLRPLNIETSIEVKELAAYLDLRAAKRIHTILGWNGLVDPDEFVEKYRSASGTNFYNFADSRVDELVARGRRELDRTRRAAIYVELQKLLAELSPAVWLYADNVYSVANRKVRGFEHVFTENHTYLKELWLESACASGR